MERCKNLDWYTPYIPSRKNHAPSQFACALAQTIPIEPGKTRLLDLGCGSGIIGIFCLIEKKARFVTFADLMPTWINETRHNLDLKIAVGAIQEAQVALMEAGTFAPNEVVRHHDLLAFNPPQLPFDYADEGTKREILSDSIENAFRNGGPDGLLNARKFFEWYAKLPTPKPDAVILLSSFLGRREIADAMFAYGLDHFELIAETDATLRPFLREAAGKFSESKMETANRSLRTIDGEWHKMLLTYRINDR